MSLLINLNIMSSRQPSPIYELGTFSANGQSNPQFSGDFRNAIFTITAANSAALTLKFLTSNQYDAPDFSQAASATNQYTTSQVIAMSDHAAIDGDTGIVFAGVSDGVARYEINENVNRWMGIQISGYSAGDVTVTLQLANNQ